METKDGCEGQEVKQSEAKTEERVRKLRLDELEFISLLRDSGAYSGKHPDDQPSFLKRLPKQVVAWEDQSELLP